ncbi:MAG TPA: tetratricopeptide repeat protein [Gemmatimonadaceae bacterium]|nr:tetratricopeptide repeat protein [Gemmatimonadaceae bacterium]
MSLTRDDWLRLHRLLNSALERADDEREAYLDAICAGDPDLRGELDSLLLAHDQPGVLDELGRDVVAPLVARFRSGAPLEGRTVTHYQIGECLGAGGMGVVYRGWDEVLERAVALKFLPPHLNTEPGAKQRFLREAQAAAALEHPNICTIYEIGEGGDGQLFIAMPFYEGETLKERISRGPLEVDDALDLAIQCARGLEHAHTHGIVHRDIKPGNLVIAPGGVLKIVDFGIAKLTRVTVSGSGSMRGTVAYMSPEQARGDQVDGRTDIWSLGVVLYEMLLHDRPFGGDHDQIVLRAILESEPPRASRSRPEVGPSLDGALARALAKRADDRFSSAAELAAELERVRAIGRDGVQSSDALPGVPPDGERRQATIVVSTLPGYGDLLDAVSPEQLASVMRQIRDAAAEIARRHGGALSPAGEEELVLLFGIPTAHEDDCIRAVRSALELHQRVRLMSEDFERSAGQTLDLHTGVDSGPVVARPAPSGLGYQVTGDAARVSAQLSAHAAADEVWISPECRRLVAPFFETQAREPVVLRQREDPLVPLRVIRESGLQTRLEAAERASLTAFTGRDHELAMLRRCRDRALRGAGQLATVVGEAGMGKSRLLHEFRHELDRDQVEVLRGRCQSYGSGTAYLPFIEALRGMLRLGDIDDPAGQIVEVLAAVRHVGPELEEFIPLYLSLLSIPSEEYIVPGHLRGEQFRLAMQEALAAAFTLSALQRPAVVLLEDWHWADDASHAVLEQLIEVAADYPLLLVVTYRPGYGVRWAGASQHTPLGLQPLEKESSLAMLMSLLHAEHVPDDLSSVLHERTGGNPFFLEEICQALLEEGTIQVEQGRVRLTGSADALELPETIQAVIRTRLDRLDRDSREILRLASVVGREFSRSILDRTLSEIGRLPNALQSLKRAGLIQQTRVVPDAAYRFKHVLTQEVAYGSLLEHQRKDLHGRVGEAIEAVHQHRIEEHLERLAHHFSRAAKWRKAVEYALRSAARADELRQFSEALQILERALGWLTRVREDSGHSETWIAILLRQERLCETLGLRGRQEQIIGELITVLEAAGDRATLAEAYVRQGDVCTLVRRFDDAESALQRSLLIRQELADAVGERYTLRSLGLLRWHQGRDEEALAFVERALTIDRQLGDLQAILGDLSNIALVLKGMGEYERARAFLEDAVRLLADSPTGARTPQAAIKQSYILHNLAIVHRALGDNDRAQDYLRQSQAHTANSRLPIQLSYHLTTEAHLRLQQGEIDESLGLYHEAVELTRKAEFAPGLAQSLRFLGELLLGLGRRAEALPHLREAAGLFAQLKDQATESLLWCRVAFLHEQDGRYGDAMAAWGRARTLRRASSDRAGEMEAVEGLARVTRLHVAEPSLALGYYREALEIAGSLGDPVAEGRLRNTIGILEWGQGRFEDALHHFEEALTIFRRLEDPDGAGLMLNSIGVTLRAAGRRAGARERLEEAIAFHRRHGRHRLEGHALAALGDLFHDDEYDDRAMECYTRSLEIRRQIGDRSGEGWMLHHLARTELQGGLIDRFGRHAAEAEQIATECEDAELIASCRQLRRTSPF